LARKRQMKKRQTREAENGKGEGVVGSVNLKTVLVRRFVRLKPGKRTTGWGDEGRKGVRGRQQNMGGNSTGRKSQCGGGGSKIITLYLEVVVLRKKRA